MTNRPYTLALKRYVQSSFSCLYLIAGGFFRAKHRPLLYTLSTHFGYEPQTQAQPRPEARVPVIPFGELLGSNTTLTLTELPSADGNISPLELIVIAGLARQSNPRLAFEIGTFDGRTTLNIALNQPPGAEILTLDLPANEIDSVTNRLDEADRKFIQKEESGARFKDRPTPARIVQLYGDSAKYDMSSFKNRVDFMFVDGSHSYDYVINDSQVALSMVHPGGLIVWHDYDTPCWPGVTLALNELQAHNPAFKNIKHIAGTTLCVLERPAAPE